MHQLPRGSRKSALPAPVVPDEVEQEQEHPPATRDPTQQSDVGDELDAGRQRPSSTEGTGSGARSAQGQVMAGHSSEAMSKLNQIVQVRCGPSTQLPKLCEGCTSPRWC